MCVVSHEHSFFPHVQGNCRFGDKCTFRHETNVNRDAEEAMSLCPFFLKGICRHVEKCRRSHGSDGNNDENDEDDFDQNPNERCGICLNNIVRSGKRYALLSGCSHCFCFECLQKWHKQTRSSKISRGESGKYELIKHSCPECRCESDFVIPSKEFYAAGEEKDELIAEYKQEKASMSCKFFTGEIGSCPFGPECFYAHMSADGKDLKSQDVRRGDVLDQDEEAVSGDVSSDDEYIMTEELAAFIETLERRDEDDTQATRELFDVLNQITLENYQTIDIHENECT